VNRAVWDEGRELRPTQHVDDYCVDRSIAFLEEARGRKEPFVLFHATQLPHMDNHHAWPSPKEFGERYDATSLPLPATVRGDLTGKPSYLETVRNRTRADEDGYRDPINVQRHTRDYYAVISQLDAMIGRLLDALERLGLRENTWIIFASDNGWLLGEHRMTSKVLAYSDSIRVPLLIAGPAITPRVETGIALNIDLAPTLLDLAGRTIPPEMHGRSLLPLLRDSRTAWRDVFVYECLDSYGGTQPMMGAISKDWSLIQTWENRAAIPAGAVPFAELYDRKSDPAESRNVAADPSRASIRARLESEIRQHLEKIGRDAIVGAP
jgi:arylsulfatase A-like enzyme